MARSWDSIGRGVGNGIGNGGKSGPKERALRHRVSSVRAFTAIAAALVLGSAGVSAAGKGRQESIAGRTVNESQRLFPVKDSIVWNPEAATLKAIVDECGKANETGPAACFIKGMKAQGASADAVAFSEMLVEKNGGSPGYTTDFTEGGKVAVARVVFPLQPSPNQHWVFINGSPEVVDANDLALLPKDAFDGDFILQEIRRTFPGAAVFTSNRSDPSPALVPLSDGGQRFLVGYPLMNGCQACANVGHSEVAFDFASDGKFEGATLLGLWMRKDQGTLVAVQAGRDFTLHMLSSHSAGFSWQLASALDEKVVKFVSKEYSEPGGVLGKKGVEKWTMHAVAPGKTIIRLENVRAGETDPPPDRKFYFAVTVQ